MQRHLIVVILYGSTYTTIKLQKCKNCKYHKIISVGNNFVFIYISLSVGVWWHVGKTKAYMPPYTHRQQYINEDKIVPNTDNFMIFAIFTFLQFYSGTDTAIQNNDSEMSLHYKPMRLIFMNYSV